MYTQTIKMPVQKDSNIVKIAVKMTEQVPQLIEFNQKHPLTGIIQELCNGWGLSDPDSYSLQFSESNNQNYITEKNRNEVKNGSILRLEFSPSKTASDILAKLNNGSVEEKTAALQKLSTLSTDMTFALEFINKQGLALIISQVEGEKYKGNVLAYSLQSFVELMDHGIVSWDILESPFINKVASYVNNQAITQDTSIIEASLSILENIVLNSSGKYGQVEKEVTFPNLVMHLQSMSPQIQQNAIALINALFLKADLSKRRAVAATLQSKQVRNVFLTNIIQSTGQVGAEMAHQLYVLQTLVLSLWEQRMMTKMDPQDQDAHDKIKELRRIAFDTEGAIGGDVAARKQGLFAKDYKKLGFKYDINPALDFIETPPGMLALDCMVYFARNHTEAYTKVVLENSCRADEHECPFGRTSVELVKLLCEVLRIGEAPSEQGQSYHPMFFTHDHPFEEFYCACIVLLNKTWKEMRATTEDFVKVFSVVREQITRALQCKPTGLDKFKNKLQQLTYSTITNLWQQERTSREEWESHARPIVELREQITPEILELIQQQRLGFLVEGTRFMKYSARGQRIKDKFWYVRLSPNHKVFHYGDCDEKSVPTIDELPTKLAVVEIRGLLTGRDCPHMKDLQRRKTTHQLAFSLVLDSVEVSSLDFVAPDEQVFDYWTDGISALLGNRMTSKEADNDLETLLSMDIKLRLLDAEGIDIPQDPPTIPDPPPNYDFCYELKLKKNDATDAVTTTGIFSRLKLADLTTVTELTIQRDHHPTIVPISFKRLHHLIDRTWDTMEAIGSRPFRAINTPGNRNIFEKGMLILSEAKVAFAQRAHIDKPDEDLPARKYYTSDELKDLNNMVTSLPLPLAIYLECIGNVKQGERIITPLLCQNENDVLSGAVSYAPRQLLPLLRILRTGVPRNGPIFQLAFQLEGLPGLVWEEFVPQDQPAPPDGDPIYVRLSPASADFWLDGPPQQENVRWTDAEYRIFQKIVRSLNFKKGFNVEVDLEHGNGTPAQFVQFADDWSVDASTRWLSMVEISDYDAKLGIVSRLEMLTDVTYLHDFEVPTPRQWTEAK